MANNFSRAHVLKKALHLNDGDFRDRMEVDTKKRSLRLLTSTELNFFVDRMQADIDSNDNDNISRKPLAGRYAKKLQALWISAWNLGIVSNRRDEAMIAFVKRQTGVDHTRFLVDADDGKGAVEGLKKWMEREAEVYWNAASNFPAYILPPVFPVVLAQWHLLSPDVSGVMMLTTLVEQVCIDQDINEVNDIDWIKASKKFGVQIRKMKARN